MDQDKQSEWIENTRVLLASLPPDYAASHAEIVAFRHSFQAELAHALQARLNEHIKTAPQDSYEEQHLLATWINRELRLLGLAIKDPKTGRPAIVVVDNQDAQHAKTRFRLQVRDGSGRQIKTLASTRMFDLALMEQYPREEGAASWTDRTGRYKGPRQRPM